MEIQLIILLYHRISDDLEPGDLIVPVEKFREQMEFLKRNCQVISLEQFLLGHHVTKSPVTSKTRVIITFDDGYRDNYLNAYPILKKLGLPAIIFLITSMIGTDKKRERYKHLPSPDMLSWQEVDEMAENGILFASHTHRHPHLLELSSQQQRDEIEESIATLGHKVTMTVRKPPRRGQSHKFAFAYPYGEYNQDTLKILKELEIEYAFTVEPKINTSQTNPLELGRIGIHGLDTIEDFRKKCEGKCGK